MKRFKKIKILSILTITLLFTSTLTILPVYAATPEEIEDSIALGVPWLASQQNPNGSWGSYYLTARTGLAVLKLIDYVKEVPDIDSWTDPNYIYHNEVVNGLNYLFSNAYSVPISLQPAGDPDTRANGLGIRFSGFDDYETSIALIALGATMTPARIVTVGPFTGETYADVVQDIVDYLSYIQRESTWARGGWGYEGNPNWADNSVSGYASLGLGYAQGFGATIPQFVKDELTHWIGIIQSPAGYSYYRPPAVWSTPYGDLLLRTGNLLYEMALVGMPVEDPNVQSALTYIENNWALGGNSYQRTYCLMKGLEVYGISGEISVGVSGDWFDELSTHIVSTQNPGGNWPPDPHDYPSPYPMTAAWALLTLERSVAPLCDEGYIHTFGTIYDKDSRLDTFKIDELRGCAGLAEAVVDLCEEPDGKTVVIEIKTEDGVHFKREINGCEFVENASGNYVYYKPGKKAGESKEKYTLMPDKGWIDLYGGNVEFDPSISDPNITVKVAIDGYCCENTIEWREFPYHDGRKFHTP